MFHHSRSLLTLFFSLLLSVTSYAQSQSAGTSIISGRVDAMLFDSIPEPLPMANVALMGARDSVTVKNTSTNSNGAFSLLFTPEKGKEYMLKVSYTGMAPVFKALQIKGVRTDAGVITLSTDLELGEVTVKAAMKDIELVGDTTVINVDAFKTSEGALLEELVNLIPGMEYDAEAGTLTYNDEPIKEININGQTFDLGGAAAVMETIPVEILQTLKVYDKTDEMEKFSGRRRRRGSADKNMVLDLNTRDGFGSMLVAKARVGLGTENKHEYAADVNRFKKQGDNLSLMAQRSNLRASSDYKDNTSDRLSAGFVISPREKMRVNARVNYNHNITGTTSTSGNEQYLITGTRWNYSARENVNKNHSLSASAGFNGEIAKVWYLTLNGSYNRSSSSGYSGSRTAAFKHDPDLDFRNPFEEGAFEAVADSARLNQIRQQSLSGSGSDRAQARADIMRTFNDKKTNLSLSTSYNYNKSTSENFSLSRTTYYELRDILGGDSLLLRNQFRLSPTHTNSVSATVALSQKLSDKINLDFKYGINSSHSRRYTNTYDLTPFFSPEVESPASWLPEGYDSGYTDSLSNRSNSNTLTHNLQLSFNYFTEPLSVLFNMTVAPEHRTLDQKTGRARADTVRNSINYQPDLTIALRPGATHIDISYKGNTEQPSLSNLLTLTDNSDPLNISRGNPDLSPSYSQNIEATLDNRDLGIYAGSRWSNTYNSVTQCTTYNLETGGVETYPVNISGNWQWRNSLRYNLRFLDRFRVSTNGEVDLSQNVGLLNENRQPDPSRSITRGRNLSSTLRLTYSPGWGSMNASARWRHNFSKNNLRDSRNYVRSYTFSYDVFATLPGNVQLKSDISYSFRNGTNIIPGEDDQLIWNLQASWRFLRKRAAELKIEWRDILSNAKDFRRNVSATGVSETYSRVIGSYFLATFRYNLNIFNGKGEPPRMRGRRDRGGDRDFDRGGDRGGFGGGGGRGGFGGGGFGGGRR